MLPVLPSIGLGQFGWRVFQGWGQHYVFLNAQLTRRKPLERIRQFSKNGPIRACAPNRVHRGLQWMDKRMHVGGVEVSLFVPGGSWQDHIAEERGGIHAKIDGNQQV